MADGGGGQELVVDSIGHIFSNIDTINTNMNQMNIDINQRISDTTIDTNQRISDTREEILLGQEGMKTLLQSHIDSDRDMVTSRRFRITTGIQWVAIALAFITIVVTIIIVAV